ncbi:uncharacterized protein LOC121389894 [Gigantopelta aegis]|uniref:uncharacterized protein LOC121389894 n=1 Tax=Gigantopelta aegis TaxID=1735272 RepID=UPI001B88D075|nr:uncharacterized protein LOC121389894 [Gigantopelta aegis]
MLKVAVIVLLVTMTTLSYGKTVSVNTLVKVPSAVYPTMYIKAVKQERRIGFLKFTNKVLRYTGAVSCSLNWQDWAGVGRRKRMCSSLMLILLRAYCQWLVDAGVQPLDSFCYEPPLNFKQQ